MEGQFSGHGFVIEGSRTSSRDQMHVQLLTCCLRFPCFPWREAGPGDRELDFPSAGAVVSVDPAGGRQMTT